MFCRYLADAVRYPHHRCTTTFGDPVHGDKGCQYELAAQTHDVERRDVAWARALYVAFTRTRAAS